MEASDRTLTLVIRGVNHANDLKVIFPELAALFSKGQIKQLPHRVGIDYLLFSLFGGDVAADKDIPVAAVTRILDLAVVDKSWWLRADPVHLAPSRQGLTMTANRSLELTATEADMLVQEITKATLEKGWVLKAANPHRWYLKPAEPADITTTPLDVVMDSDISQFLPAGADAKSWHTRLNEIQILLHTCESNTERESNSKLPVNSVWFWGGGSLPQLKSTSWTTLWSDDVLSLALARLSETSNKKIPQSLSQWAELADAGDHLMVIDRDQLLKDMQASEQNPADVLRKMLENKLIGQLTIYAGSNLVSVITPKQLKPRWNWRFPFSRS